MAAPIIINSRIFSFLFWFCALFIPIYGQSLKDGLLLITIATDETDGFHRLMDSAKFFGYDVKVLGLGMKWTGGNMDYAGGGQKVNLLKAALEEYETRDDLLIMFVDSYDVVLTATYDEVIKTFKKFDANVVFSAEGFCWPDLTLKVLYPKTKATEYRYLNSGGFVGVASSVYQLVTASLIDDEDDDQLYYTRLFLDEEIKNEIGIKLDTRAEIFQNLNGALGEVEVKHRDGIGYLYNTKTGTHSLAVHGNGPVKVAFNSLANYLGRNWSPAAGCVTCNENTISLQNVQAADYPSVLLGLFVPIGMPFLQRYFDTIRQLDYPKIKIHLFIYNSESIHESIVEKFADTAQAEYASLRLVRPRNNILLADAKNEALEECVKKACQYYLYVDAESRLTDTQTLKLLIEQNRTVLAPKVSRKGKLWSNFWGAVRSDGYYARSNDYAALVNAEIKGVWNVPYVGSVYLIHASMVNKVRGFYKATKDEDSDVNFANMMRKKGYFMHMTNMREFGYMIDPEQFDKSRKNPDMYEIFANRQDWEREYISDEFANVMNPDVKLEEPCPDVYWFPVMSDRFCYELIDEAEHFGSWSSGGHQAIRDDRLGGSYENVPTVDIHMNQIGFEQHWLQFLRLFIQPVQLKLYLGYYHDPPNAVMNFIVRYRPREQDHLKPHHDASTYTINVALNTFDVDYEGGGVRFVRYDCRVEKTRRGWALMHPGRLTHYHEGLVTRNGTRYIMVSFIDP